MDGPDFITGWLDDLGLAHYTESFTKRGITLTTLADWGGAGQEDAVNAALAQINAEHPEGILLNEYGHGALFRTALKKLAKRVAAPKDGIQIGANIVLTIAGVDDSDDCYGPLKAGDRGKVVDAAGVGARKSYKVETADKATWWYKAGSIQLSAAVHTANSVVDALRKQPGNRQVRDERRRQTMESIDSGTASRFSRGTSVSGMSGVSEEPDLSDLDFLMEDQAALLIQNWFHRFKRRKAGRAALEARRQAKIELEERKRAEERAAEARAAQAEAQAQAIRLKEEARAAANALATRIAEEERLLVEAEAARAAALERLAVAAQAEAEAARQAEEQRAAEALAAEADAAATRDEEMRAAAAAVEASVATASAAVVPSAEDDEDDDESDAMALLEEMEGLARRNTESLRRFGDADELIEQYEELIETEGGYIETQLSKTRDMANGNMSLPMVSVKLAQMMVIIDEVGARRQAATEEIEKFGHGNIGF